MSRAGGLTMADVDPEGIAECFHCETEFVESAPVSVEGNYIVVYCRKCGCLTPFKRAA